MKLFIIAWKHAGEHILIPTQPKQGAETGYIPPAAFKVLGHADLCASCWTTACHKSILLKGPSLYGHFHTVRETVQCEKSHTQTHRPEYKYNHTHTHTHLHTHLESGVIVYGVWDRRLMCQRGPLLLKAHKRPNGTTRRSKRQNVAGPHRCTKPLITLTDKYSALIYISSCHWDMYLYHVGLRLDMCAFLHSAYSNIIKPINDLICTEDT